MCVRVWWRKSNYEWWVYLKRKRKDSDTEPNPSKSSGKFSFGFGFWCVCEFWLFLCVYVKGLFVMGVLKKKKERTQTPYQIQVKTLKSLLLDLVLDVCEFWLFLCVYVRCSTCFFYSLFILLELFVLNVMNVVSVVFICVLIIRTSIRKLVEFVYLSSLNLEGTRIRTITTVSKEK